MSREILGADRVMDQTAADGPRTTRHDGRSVGRRPSSLRVLLLLAATLTLGVALTIALGIGALGMPARDAELLALYLALSSSTSVAVGLGSIALAPRLGLGRLGPRLIFAYLVVLAVAYFNIVLTAQLMFISFHDLGLLGLLLIFSAAVALCFAVVISGSIVGAIRSLALAARQMAAGDLKVRVEPSGGVELADLAETFNLMAEKLEAAEAGRADLEQARRDLIAAVSHDLRTPLASIRAMVEAINDGVVSDRETTARYLRTVQAEVGRLTDLIDDLFELSRLDAGVLELHLSTGSVHDLLSGALESLRPQAEAKGVRLDGRVATDLPPVVMDERRVQRVLYNLIQNAVRHTPSDGSVLLGAEELAESVRVDVVDSGEGVPEADLPRIFDRFYRGEKSRARHAGGAGLGLAIARGIVEAHGGRLWAQNLAGRGAHFSFTLPKAATARRRL